MLLKLLMLVDQIGCFAKGELLPTDHFLFTSMYVADLV